MGKNEIIAIIIGIIVVAGLIFVTNRPGQPAWKTYQNNYLSLSYPQSWIPQESQGDVQSVVFIDSNAKASDQGSREILTIRMGADDKTLDQYKSLYKPTTDTTVGGIPAIKSSTNIYLVKPNPNLTVSIDAKNPNVSKYIDQILSSIKFVK